MKVRKTVTERKRSANRRNAQLSTGPRTELGRYITKFNAVKMGLFAKNVVIPLVDGIAGQEEFAELLADLVVQFQPENTFENFCVG